MQTSLQRIANKAKTDYVNASHKASNIGESPLCGTGKPHAWGLREGSWETGCFYLTYIKEYYYV
jgi:hypothetical protein